MFLLLLSALDLGLVHFCRHDCEMDLNHRAKTLLFVLVLLEHVFVFDFKCERSIFGFFKVLFSVHINLLVILNILLVVLLLVHYLVLVVEDRVADLDGRTESLD
jgi:hypothetical protein